MNKIEVILKDSISELIRQSITPKEIKRLEKKHNTKPHFIPYRYRVFNGILQSMNIKYGNFIEKVTDEIIRDNPINEIIEKYSGNKNNSFKLSKNSESLIDSYISNCQNNNYGDIQLKQKYIELISMIKDNETKHNYRTGDFKHDVDILFRNKLTNVHYYVEIKYNDDHDTGKFADINRKLLKTYAYLQRELGADIVLKPILFYFTNKRMKGNIYLPEDEVIYRGKRFFDTFTNVKYEDMDNYMKNISEDPETKKQFDDLYIKICKE